MKELQHGSHECVLTSPEIVADGICNMCHKDEAVEYACVPCNFDLCKACSDLQPKVSHEFHSEHPLEFCLRKLGQKPDHILCSGCGNLSSDHYYKCKECEIYLDLDCARLPNIFRSWDAEEKLHYSHAHFLKRCRPGPDVRGSCLLCQLPLSPSAICYGCICCYKFVHEGCCNNDIPTEIQHPVHPAHPLRRLDYTQNCGLGIHCDGCGYKFASVPIGCLECKFYLHLRCADSLLRCLMHKSHQHKLFYVDTNAVNAFKNHPCQICKRNGVISIESYYRCAECGWKIHFECFEIPQSVVVKKFHIHPLVCKRFRAEDDSLEYCGVCETMVDAGHHAYSCNECDFVGHIECILRKETPSPLYLKDLYSCGEGVARRTNREENKLMVNDIGHIHVLQTFNGEGIRCTICCEGISGISWACETCNFRAHDYCAKLGQPSRHRLHLEHDLVLLPSYPTRLIMNCNTCKEEIRGFNLFCRICNLITCIKCVAKFNHLLGVSRRGQKVIGTTDVSCFSYQHHLFRVLVSRSYPIPCTICDERLCGKVLSCMDCGDIYHPYCIQLKMLNLPRHPSHSWHMFQVNWVSGFKCVACKLNIPKYGFSCLTCQASFHMKCSRVLSKDINFHKHTFYNFWVDDKRVTPACSVCSRFCGASFYGCIDCSFSAHVECLGFPAILKSKKHQHTISDDPGWYEKRCAICKLECGMMNRYSCKYCEDAFHRKCIMSMDVREAATKDEQLGDIYFMYIERFLLNTFKEEE